MNCSHKQKPLSANEFIINNQANCAPTSQDATHSQMASKLNPAAAEFVPGSFAESWISNMSSTEDCSEDHITPEELAELEAAEEWVELQSALEEEEEEHVIAVALRYAPQSKVAEIQKNCGLKPAKLRVHRVAPAHGAVKGI